jgi:hypothetical protein
MKGVSRNNRLKLCSQASGAGEQFLVSKPGEANHRAAVNSNPNEPRNTKMGTARVSEILKPALMQESTTQLHEVLRGQREQRDGTEMLGTWENPGGVCGVSRAQRVRHRINKMMRCRREVGEVHSSDEVGENRWSEGALATDMLTQKRRELIGR